MSFARHNHGRSLFGHAKITSKREQELLAENNLLREKNKRLSDAILTLVDHIETKFPSLENHTVETATASQGTAEPEPATPNGTNGTKVNGGSERPRVEVFETYEEPIEFADPAPQMRFDQSSRFSSGNNMSPGHRTRETKNPEYVVSPDLAPDEIDLLKSPTKERSEALRRQRETVDVVDLKPKSGTGVKNPPVYEESTVNPSNIPNFDFADETPAEDIELKRRETLRAAMRRRVNRLRW